MSAGAVCDVAISGNLDDVSVNIALDACASIFGHEVCGSDLTSDLPWTVLAGEYDFGSLCKRAHH